MKTYSFLGLNHRLRIPIAEDGAIVLMRCKHRRVQTHIYANDAFTAEITGEWLGDQDTGSSEVFPLPVEVYGLNEAMLGVALIAAVEPHVLESVADSLRATGKEVTHAVIDDALQTMVRKFPKPANAYLTSKEKRGAEKMWTGFMADVICGLVSGKKMEMVMHTWSPPDAAAESRT